MRTIGVRTARAVALAVALAGAVVAASMPASAAAPAGAVVELDQSNIATHVGDRFTFGSTIRNPGSQPLEGLVAHLNVLSLDRDVYVDPEDWSSARTQFLPRVAAGGSARLTWTVQAVNQGRIVIYVTVVSERASDEVDASATLRATVTAQERLSARGVLPVALAMPAVTLLLLIASLRRRWRLT